MIAATRLGDLLERAATTAPDAPAILLRDRKVTFQALAARARSIAHAARATTAPGASVAVIGDNHLDWVAAYYGVSASGRRLCFLNHRLAFGELTEQMDRAQTELIIGAAHELERLQPTVSSMTFGDDLAPATQPLDGAREIDGAWLLFTSGTTGRPKGALLSSESVLAACAASAAARPIDEDEVFAFPFPLCHVAGYNVVRLHQQLRPVVLLERFDAGQLIDAIEHHQVTSVSLAATMLAALLDEIERTDSSRRLASLRTIAYGAAPMPPALLRRAATILGVELTQGYGMTELSGNAVFLDAADHQRGLTEDPTILSAIGRPGPGVQVRLLAPDGTPAAQDEVGEILVAGPQVMVGYLDDGPATAATKVDGWLHTGDLGRRRADGLLEIVDRLKDMIITGGENVASLEVEDAIAELCPELEIIAVVGVADERWGQNVCCCATLAPGASLTMDELADRLAVRLAGYKIPRHLVLLDSIPLTHSGKVAKAALRDHLADHTDVLGQRRGSNS